MANETIEVLRIPGTLFPRGAFDENASYKFLNIVESGGSGYVCLQPCTGIPVTNTAYWFKFVFKGDKGDAFTYADLTAEQKAELVRDATAAAQAAASSAQSAADDAAAALQKFNTIKAAIDAIDPQSTEGSIQTLAAKQGLLEADLNALGPKIDNVEAKIDGRRVYVLPDAIKELNWETGTRKVKYEDDCIVFAVQGVTGCNVSQAKSDFLQDEDAFIYVDSAFWSSDKTLDVVAELTGVEYAKLRFGYYKDNAITSFQASDYEFQSSGEKTIDLKALLKSGNATSYSHIYKITIFGLTLSESGDATLKVKGFEDSDSYVEGVNDKIATIQGNVTALANNDVAQDQRLKAAEGYTSLVFEGADNTPKTQEFDTIAGHKYLVAFPSNGWTIGNITSDVTVFVVSAYNDGVYTDYSETRVMKRGFADKGLSLEFTATSNISRIYMRTDSGTAPRFLIIDESNDSIALNAQRIVETNKRIEDVNSKLPWSQIFSIVGNGRTAIEKKFDTQVGLSYRVIIPNGWTVDETYNYSPDAIVLQIRTFDGDTGSDISSTKIPARDFGLAQYLDFVAPTNISSIWLRADTGCEFDVKIVSLDEISVDVLDIRVSALENKAVLNPFLFKPFVHHINVSQGNNININSESLLDIMLAKRTGARFIEANVHKCSDGVYVVRHGVSGKLGYGLLFSSEDYDENTLFTEISSSDLRAYVKCNSNYAKWQAPIPTLEEFCKECGRQSMGILVQCIDEGVLPIVRQHLSDDKIIAYSPKKRGNFKGTIINWASASTAADMLNTAKQFGKPFCFGWSNYKSVSDDVRKEALSLMHNNGYYVGTAYLQPADMIHALELGLDELSSTVCVINPFDDGTLFHIVDANDNNLSASDGVSYDSTTKELLIPNGGQIVINSPICAEHIVKANVRIRYTGTLTICIGHISASMGVVDYSSDGSHEVHFAGISEFESTPLIVSAGAATTIHDIAVDVSLVM